jgi:hypothetical protein
VIYSENRSAIVDIAVLQAEEVKFPQFLCEFASRGVSLEGGKYSMHFVQ